MDEVGLPPVRLRGAGAPSHGVVAVVCAVLGPDGVDLGAAHVVVEQGGADGAQFSGQPSLQVVAGQQVTDFFCSRCVFGGDAVAGGVVAVAGDAALGVGLRDQAVVDVVVVALHLILRIGRGPYCGQRVLVAGARCRGVADDARRVAVAVVAGFGQVALAVDDADGLAAVVAQRAFDDVAGVVRRGPQFGQRSCGALVCRGRRGVADGAGLLSGVVVENFGQKAFGVECAAQQVVFVEVAHASVLSVRRRSDVVVRGRFTERLDVDRGGVARRSDQLSGLVVLHRGDGALRIDFFAQAPGGVVGAPGQVIRRVGGGTDVGQRRERGCAVGRRQSGGRDGCGVGARARQLPGAVVAVFGQSALCVDVGLSAPSGVVEQVLPVAERVFRQDQAAGLVVAVAGDAQWAVGVAVGDAQQPAGGVVQVCGGAVVLMLLPASS